MLHLIALLVMSAEPSFSSLATRVSAANDQVVGGAMAPAALPAGTMAFWGLLGAPDLGVGYRQGFSAFELEAKATFNYLELSAVFEAGVRVPVFRRNRLQVAPTAGVGLQFNSGSTYYDPANFASVALRPRLGAVASYELSDTVQALALVDVPWAISLNVVLGNRFSLLTLGQLGFDVLKAPLGVTQARAAWAIRLGVGYRLF